MDNLVLLLITVKEDNPWKSKTWFDVPQFSETGSSQLVPPPITLLLSFFVLDSWWRCNGSVNEAWRGESWTMPKGGGAKTPQLDHFPLNTDMVEKQGGKKVRPANDSVSLE